MIVNAVPFSKTTDAKTLTPLVDGPVFNDAQLHCGSCFHQLKKTCRFSELRKYTILWLTVYIVPSVIVVVHYSWFYERTHLRNDLQFLLGCIRVISADCPGVR